MPKLNQILAIEKQTKTNAYEQMTQLHQALQKEPLLNGISRTYQPLDEEGEKFPKEETQVQVKAAHCLEAVRVLMCPLYDITLARDAANCSARSDVIVNGVTILKDVPATYLLWLEKQFVDLHTLIVKLPVLAQSESWNYDGGQDCYKTEPTQTAKTKKIPRAFVKYEATKEHPAQVDVVGEDVLQGYWTTIKYSGALPKARIQELRARVEALLAAVKFAREQANLVEVPKVEAGKAVFDFLLA